MAEDSTATAYAEIDPETDTDLEQQGDTAENTQQAQQPTVEQLQAELNELRTRNTGLQQWNTREAQKRRALEDELIQTRQQQQQPARYDPSDPFAAREAELQQRERAIREQQDWAEIEREHPREVIETYSEFQRAYALDPTPRGAIRATEAALQTFGRALAASQPQGAQPKGNLPSRDEAVRPRVDTSRSDAPDLDAIDRRIAGAQEHKDLLGGIKAILDRNQARGRK